MSPQFRPSYNGYLADTALYWLGSSNDSFGQIVISHEDIVEAARNPRIVARRALRNPAVLAIVVGIAYTLWRNRRDDV